MAAAHSSPQDHDSSPSLSPPRSVVDRVATPLSLFFDSSSTRRVPAVSREDPFAAMSLAETPEPARQPPLAVGPTAQGPDARARAARQYEPPSLDPVARMTNTMSPPDSSADSHSPLSDLRPLRTASVRADTRLAQPTPMPSTSQPGSDLKMRPGSPRGNIAQLEATAERLSMTSSIDDAIRDLHGELKRSDSRRSSLLAASLRASSADAPSNDHYTHNNDEATAAVEQLRQHLSASSSIVSTNTAARQGGYSPAAFVMSPTHSLSGRLRSGSKSTAGRPDLDFDPLLSRHGPGKASDRSARSAKMSLAEISESEPVSLTQAALDEADVAPPIEELVGEGTLMLSRHHGQHLSNPGDTPRQDDDTRCTSSHSNNTFQQCRDAFIDFDGVHWEPEPEHDLLAPLEIEQDLPTPRGPSTDQTTPQSYLDPESGQEMQYYPARVPAMLNVPPKLSNKIKTVERNQRQSKVLSVMMDTNGQPALPEAPWQSEPNSQSAIPEAAHPSWLPDPIAGQRDSFAMLSPPSPRKSRGARSNNGDEGPPTTAGAESEGLADTLRRPQRLSALDSEKRKSRASFLTKLPPQLRASAFFDLPSVTADVEIKDGSAMATLDSILDASATAPVSVFTDHAFVGKLGPEVYGKKKKHKSRKSTATLGALSAAPEPEPEPEPEPRPKKRSSLMWLRRRTSNNNIDEKKRPRSMASAPVLGADAGAGVTEDRKSADGSGDDKSVHDEATEAESESDKESEEEEEAYHGPPSTLLAELQLRKQEQQLRKKNMGSGFPNGIHATLLEMDTVAETQRRHRQTKRVNLAWEEPGAHLDQNGSEDEDVPLAILAAMHHGAKNRADLERPMGLMERRALEDNEPLSRRRARLQGLDTLPVALQKRQSVMSFPALGAVENRSPLPVMGPVLSPASGPVLSPASGPVFSPASGPEEEDGEAETLGARRRRLAATESVDAKLPQSRPLSISFSAELLSQFGDLDKAEGKPVGDKADAPQETTGEETLGQRRRRLQAEKEAREQEMSHGNMTAGSAQRISRRISMADVLAAHPKKDSDVREKEDEVRRVDENRAVMEREAKMAAMRKQMPQSLIQPNVERSGGFRGGAYNDGNGGCGPQISRNSVAFAPQGLTQGPYGYGNYNRSSVLLNNYKGPAQQPMYGAMSPSNHVGAYDGINATGLFNGNTAMSMYGGGLMPPVAVNGGSMDRVERWRRGVHP
ncbi:hypothetical protein HRG_000850 [Hirsutella rhossiliensis]|uniref:Uncharacterized protein n=1 Tax=Hirsutella rhossiliensis TaxID=111463 RepID=A0A9P8SM51_9HYPO|nr:uncharacterized protein HRG_00850 [Hirsutella rhossiliensis]KAH0968208.1 hypothetical protein HRG_00850 [Hirsutella rhossiliensis]